MQEAWYSFKRLLALIRCIIVNGVPNSGQHTRSCARYFDGAP